MAPDTGGGGGGGGSAGIKRLQPLSSEDADEVFDELEEWLKSSGDDDASDAVYDYTGDTARRLNRLLRSGVKPDKHDRKLIKALDRAAENGWVTKDVPLFRGVDDASWDEQFAKVNVGDMVKDKGFVSTSLDPSTAAKFSTIGDRRGGMMEILIHRGQNVVAAAGIGEMEILLPRKQSMRVTSIDKESRVVVLEAIES